MAGSVINRDPRRNSSFIKPFSSPTPRQYHLALNFNMFPFWV